MTTFAIYDYETNCAYDEQPLSSTAFCGSCARKNNRNLFWNVNSPLTYNQVNFTSMNFNFIYQFFYSSYALLIKRLRHYRTFKFKYILMAILKPQKMFS